MTGASTWIPYCGAAPTPAEWLGRWNLDPVLLAALALLGLAYHFRFRAEASARRGAFAAAMGGLLILFVSPFCALTSALFSARVVHHVALAAVVAPLLVLSLPRFRAPSLPLATAIHTVIFWAWHAPALYAWALSHDWAYWLGQIALLGSAVLFWAAIRRASAPAAAAALLVFTVQMGLLGSLITFAAGPLYAPHLASTLAWGYAPLEDQQLAGLVMWAPSAGFYLLAALFLVGRWLGQEDRLAAA